MRLLKGCRSFGTQPILRPVGPQDDGIRCVLASGLEPVPAPGKTLVHFDRQAQSLDDALRSAVADVQAAGWKVQEITVEPHCLQTTPAS